MSVSIVKSTRAMEHENGDVDPYDVQLIKPCRMSIIDQDTIQQKEFELFLQARRINITTKMLPYNKHRYDVWGDDYGSVKNLLCAYYTQQGQLQYDDDDDHEMMMMISMTKMMIVMMITL